MRCAFANYVEHGIMGDWPRMLMREMMVETLRARGFEVTWEYVVRDGEGRLLEDEEEAEEKEGLFGEEDEVLSGEERESENGDEDEEMDTDGEDGEEESDCDDIEMETGVLLSVGPLVQV
jgi:hypothetical protein